MKTNKLFNPQFSRKVKEIYKKALERWGKEFSLEITLFTDQDYRICAVHTNKDMTQELILFETSDKKPKSLYTALKTN